MVVVTRDKEFSGLGCCELQVRRLIPEILALEYRSQPHPTKIGFLSLHKVMAKRHYHDLATRAQALALLEEKIPVQRIVEITQMSKTSIFRLQRTAKSRGYNPSISRQLKVEYLEDGLRSGQPTTVRDEV